jgi:hypothetical protein
MSTTTTFRHLCGRHVQVHSDGLELSGVMLSVTRRSVWLLVGDDDVIVDLAVIQGVEAA